MNFNEPPIARYEFGNRITCTARVPLPAARPEPAPPHTNRNPVWRPPMTNPTPAVLAATLRDLAGDAEYIDHAAALRALADQLDPTPPMDEPTWPGAPVVAGCGFAREPHLHTRTDDGIVAWYCLAISGGWSRWSQLTDARDLTPAEYAEHRIPRPGATIVADDETVRRASNAYSACPSNNRVTSMRAALHAVGALDPYATR